MTERRLLIEEHKKEKAALESTIRAASAAEEAQRIIQNVAETIQQQVHESVAALVSRCLSGVFVDDAYQFRAVVEQKRGKTETRLVFERDGMEIDPVSAAGGGVVDIAAFALRVCSLLLQSPARRRLLVLDEPMKHLSDDNHPRAVALLESLAEEFDMQIILVTHSEELCVGKVHRID